MLLEYMVCRNFALMRTLCCIYVGSWHIEKGYHTIVKYHFYQIINASRPWLCLIFENILYHHYYLTLYLPRVQIGTQCHNFVNTDLTDFYEFVLPQNLSCKDLLIENCDSLLSKTWLTPPPHKFLVIFLRCKWNARLVSKEAMH